MADSVQMMEALDNRVRRREERRDFFKAAMGLSAAAVGGAAALGFTTQAGAQTAAPTDADILNFALNLEYLEAQFYSYAAFGTGLSESLLTGTSGTRGQVITGTGATMARAVQFGDTVIRDYAREIANDEIAHVTFLRSAGALGSAAVAQPAINIAGGAGTPFAAAATAAQVPGGSTFDPYASDDAFLLGAYIFEDVGVTAYKGASPLITSKVFLEAAAGILAVEAYHAAIVRTSLYARGVATPQLRTNADLISNARDALDGTTDLDQGISPTTVSGASVSNIVPLDNNGIAFSRTPGQVLNIVYLNTAVLTNNSATATMGGFFPAGVNGTLRVGTNA